MFRVAAWMTAVAVCTAAAAAEPVVRTDVVYRTVDGVDLKLDVATPEGDGPFPAIVFLHGGGWMSGHRSRFDGEIREAARRGYVAATVSYRLSRMGNAGGSVDGFPAAIHDVKAAVRFLRANAATYGVDPERIGVTGESAGGHLSLLVGLTRPEDDLDGPIEADSASSGVRAVVNVFGPTDLASLYEEVPRVRPLLTAFLGGDPGTRGEQYRAASPLTYVREAAPPILTLHGDRDEIVPVGQAKALDAALRRAGAEHELIVIEGSGHGFGGDAAGKARDALYAFFDETLKR